MSAEVATYHHSTRPPRHRHRYRKHDVVHVSTFRFRFRSCQSRGDLAWHVWDLFDYYACFLPSFLSTSSHILATRYHHISFWVSQ